MKCKRACGNTKPLTSAAGKESKPKLEVPTTFLADFQAAAAELERKRLPQTDDPEEAARAEAELLRADLRPVLEQEARAQVDGEMRDLLHSLRVCFSEQTPKAIRWFFELTEPL